MKRLAIVAALLAIGVAVPLSLGSSHREAPLTSIDPTADNTDVYAFTAPEAKHSLTAVANWLPFEDPAGGPNFYKFDPKARYYINIDNNGDGRYDVRYRFEFKDHVRNPNSFLYAAPTVDSIDSKNLNVYQTYDVTRLVYGDGGNGGSADESRKSGKHKTAHRKNHHKAGHHRRNGKHHRKGKSHLRNQLRSSREIVEDAFVAPNNVGPKTIPNYNAVANQAITDLPSGGRVFAGQRDDPFFVDLGSTFDAVNIDKPGRPGIGLGNKGGGKDDLAGYGVHSIVLQVPERDVTNNGEQVNSEKDKNAVVGVWASTDRRRVQVTGSSDNNGNGNDWVQVSRLGNPLVNEAVIPLGKKDFFNSTSPADDAKNFGQYVVNPELARLMNALFNLGVKETGRTDIVQALLQGIPGLNQQSGQPVDTLKLNLGTDPASSPKRLGVLAGDTAGFPNGRRLTDDVTDIVLRVVAGALINPNAPPLGDGVDQNDKPFSDQFPYLAAPNSGFNSTLKGFPPTAP
jgi:Domain of unknown function (DUF4331)